MANPDRDRESAGRADDDAAGSTRAGDDDAAGTGDSRPTLESVRERYDFDEFGPREMDEMSPEEWEVAFDADTWITGTELLDRVEQDLQASIDRRDVFAVLERERRELEHGIEERLVAYSDEGYAAVYEDGSVDGEGTVLRDVKPSVALCSMAEYEPPEPTGDGTLPDPDAVQEGGGDLGNLVLQVVGAVQVIAGVGLFAAWITLSLPIVTAVFALGFLAFGVLLLVVVANARLAARFRSEEYRDRLRSVGVEDGDGANEGDGDDERPGETR